MRPLLVTAGATRNPIDAIRYLSAHSGGSTGAAVARALAPHTHVTVLASADARARLPAGVAVLPMGSTRELLASMREQVAQHPRAVVVHAAAVGDYEAAEAAGKIPSGQEELVLRLQPTPKIVDRVCQWSPDVRLVSFKAAPPGTGPDALVEIARSQLERTRSALVFANAIGQLRSSVALVEAQAHAHFADRGDAIAALCARVQELAS